MIIKNKSNFDAGFSLIEVLVFVTIFGLFFVLAIAVTTASLRNMKVTERRIYAVRYAEEMIEWLRSEKEASWADFVTHTGTFCFNKVLGNSWSLSLPTTGLCPTYTGIGSLPPVIFKRDVVVSSSGSPVTQIIVKVTVSWQETNGVEKVEQNVRFSIWE